MHLSNRFFIHSVPWYNVPPIPLGLVSVWNCLSVNIIIIIIIVIVVLFTPTINLFVLGIVGFRQKISCARFKASRDLIPSKRNTLYSIGAQCDRGRRSSVTNDIGVDKKWLDPDLNKVDDDPCINRALETKIDISNCTLYRNGTCTLHMTIEDYRSFCPCLPHLT